MEPCKDKIFVVVGESGDYSDRVIWYVAAYGPKELAQKHADLANGEISRFMEICEKQRNPKHYWFSAYSDLAGKLNRGEFKNKYDSKNNFQDGTIEYYVEEVEFRTEVPE